MNHSEVGTYGNHLSWITVTSISTIAARLKPLFTNMCIVQTPVQCPPMGIAARVSALPAKCATASKLFLCASLGVNEPMPCYFSWYYILLLLIHDSQAISEFLDSTGGCERILRTPIPLSYSR